MLILLISNDPYCLLILGNAASSYLEHPEALTQGKELLPKDEKPSALCVT